MHVSAVYHLALVALVLVSAASAQSNPSMSIGRCPSPLPVPDSDVWNSMSSTFANPFMLASGQGYPMEPSIVYACYSDTRIHFKAITEDMQFNSNFTQCNEPLYKMDVLEFFLTFPAVNVDLHHYLEFEVSPKGVLFFAKVANANLTCPATGADLQQCAGSTVEWAAGTKSVNWWAYLSVPWSVLGVPGGYNEIKSKGYSWFGNFYRIDLLKTGERQFSCWSPTYSTPACFHKPKYFGQLKLQ